MKAISDKADTSELIQLNDEPTKAGEEKFKKLNGFFGDYSKPPAGMKAITDKVDTSDLLQT